MVNIDFDAIDEGFLQSLVDDEVPEDINLEYKRELPSKICEARLNKAEKKEILEDISAFANTDGGILIYGVQDDDGIPEKLTGLSFDEKQSIATRDKILEYAKYHLEPPIHSIDFRYVKVLDSKVALVFKVPKSVGAPHKIKLKDIDMLYGRRSNGVYPMNIDDMRAAFALSDTRIQMIRDFKDERISRFHFRNDLDLPLSGDAQTILHLIPADSFVAGKRYDVDGLFRDTEALKPMFRQGFGGLGPRPDIERRFNLDGILKYCPYVYQKEGKEGATETVWTTYTKVQLFTKGIIEASERIALNSEYTPNPMHLNIDLFEKVLQDCLSDYLNCLQHLEVTPPIFLFLTLRGVRGYELSKSWTRYPQVFGGTIDRDVLEVPERPIPDYKMEPATALKPCFDSIWNACGYPRSMNYDKEGNYRPQDGQEQLEIEVSQFLKKD
jgi:Putative DNA-binding domain